MSSGRPLLLSILIIGACGRAPGRSSNTAGVRDSAGVRIVESRQPAWTPNVAWIVDSTPALSIGTVDGAREYQLTDVQSVVVLADGRIAVVNGRTQDIRCYSPEGAFLWAAGQPGDGPGDFVRLAVLARYRGDSLFAYDFGRMGHAKYSVIGPTGRFARAWSPNAPDDTTNRLGFVGVLANGAVAIRTNTVRQPMTPPRVSRPLTRVYRYDADGKVLARLGAFPEMEYYAGEGYGLAPLPWFRNAHFAVHGDDLFAGMDDTYEIRRLRADGSVTSLIRRVTPSRPVTPSEREAERARLRAAQQARRDTFFRGMPAAMLARIAADQEKMWNEIPFPPTYPAYSEFMVDREGYLWVQEFNPARTTDSMARSWSIFDPDGRWLGDVRLPDRFALYDADQTRVLGVQTDELGVQYVRAFRILRRARA